MLFHFTTMESNRAQIESAPARTTTKTCLHCQAAALLCRLYIPFVRASFEGERESIRKLKSLTKPGDDETDDSGNTRHARGIIKSRDKRSIMYSSIRAVSLSKLL